MLDLIPRLHNQMTLKVDHLVEILSTPFHNLYFKNNQLLLWISCQIRAREIEESKEQKET